MEKDSLTIKQVLISDPNTRDPDVLKEVAANEEYSELSQKLKQFDDKLKSAIHIDVPEGLESRIILAQRMSGEDPEADVVQQNDNVVAFKKSENIPQRDYRWMSIAAALVLAVGLSLGMFKFGESQGLEQQILAHLYEHKDALTKDKNIKLASFNEMLAPHGVKVSESIGHIRYASNCPIDDKKAPHFVLSENGQPVTVMYIPWKQMPEREKIGDDKFKGVLLSNQKGSFVIFSEDPEIISRVQERVASSIEIDI